MKGRGAARKVRSDKKYSIDSVVCKKVYDRIVSLSYISKLPIKDIVELVVTKGLENREVIEGLAGHMRREYVFTPTYVFIGDPDRTKYRKPTDAESRVCFRVNRGVEEKIGELAYALDASKRAASGFLIEETLANREIVIDIITAHYDGNVKVIEILRNMYDGIFGKTFSILDKIRGS